MSEWLPILWPLAAAAVVILLLRPAIAFILLCQVRLRPVTAELRPPAFLDDEERELIASAEEEAMMQGFEFETIREIVPAAGEKYAFAQQIMLQPETGVRLSLSLMKDSLGRTDVVGEFSSLLEDETIISTPMRWQKPMLLLPDDLLVVPLPPGISITEGYQRHLKIRDAKAGDRAVLVVDTADDLALFRDCARRSFELSAAKGVILPADKKGEAFKASLSTRLSQAFVLARRPAEKQSAKKSDTSTAQHNPPAAAAPPPPPVPARGGDMTESSSAESGAVPAPAFVGEGHPDDLRALREFRQMELSSQIKLGNTTKIVLLLISLVAAFFAFRIQFSTSSVLAVLLVLAIHEGGHLLGMRLFNYQNLQMLFLPFLGAVAMGTRREVKVWQHLIVLLLGPLPGLGIGAFLFASGATATPFLFELALFFLVLNAFNLLPIKPLDGGQVLDLLLFTRLPGMQLAFTIGSGLLILGVGLLLKSSLWMLGLLLLFSIPALWREMRVASTVFKQHRATIRKEPEDVVLVRIFEAIRQLWKGAIPDVQKYQLARAALHRVRVTPPGLITTLLGAAAYLSPFWGSVLWMNHREQAAVASIERSWAEAYQAGVPRSTADIKLPPLPQDRDGAPFLTRALQEIKALPEIQAQLIAWFVGGDDPADNETLDPGVEEELEEEIAGDEEEVAETDLDGQMASDEELGEEDVLGAEDSNAPLEAHRLTPLPDTLAQWVASKDAVKVRSLVRNGAAKRGIDTTKADPELLMITAAVLFAEAHLFHARGYTSQAVNTHLLTLSLMHQWVYDISPNGERLRILELLLQDLEEWTANGIDPAAAELLARHLQLSPAWEVSHFRNEAALMAQNREMMTELLPNGGLLQRIALVAFGNSIMESQTSIANRAKLAQETSVAIRKGGVPPKEAFRPAVFVKARLGNLAMRIHGGIRAKGARPTSITQLPRGLLPEGVTADFQDGLVLKQTLAQPEPDSEQSSDVVVEWRVFSN